MVALNTRGVGCVTLMVVVATHPLASIKVYVYVPALTVNVPVPLNGATPPFALTTTVACPPLHAIGEVILATAVKAAGCVTVIVVESIQPFWSINT